MQLPKPADLVIGMRNTTETLGSAIAAGSNDTCAVTVTSMEHGSVKRKKTLSLT